MPSIPLVNASNMAMLRVAWIVVAAALLAVSADAKELSLERVNDAAYSDHWRSDRALVLKAQVLLDRARFSPGTIDGRWGMNTERAIRAYQRRHELEATGELDAKTWDRLQSESERNVLKSYEITKADVKGPFIDRVPKDLEDMAELEKLSYTGPDELLAEQFHMNIELLRELNPEAQFDRAGEKIIVTDVRNERKPGFKVARIEVDKGGKSVIAFNEKGTVLASYPATIGSAEMPSPSGTHKVTRIAMGPSFTYDPKKLSFPGVHLYRTIKIEAGPNNPVGLVWIQLSKDGYGIHGTPDPSEIGRSESHGCVRLTNWDAIELAKATRRGAKVEFIE